MIDTHCEQCGKAKRYSPSAFYRAEHHFCSHACRFAWDESNRNRSVKCDACGKIFKRKLSHALRNERRGQRYNYCGRECMAAGLHHLTGEENPCWRGGRRKKGEYMSIYQPGHPNSTRAGYVLEHRLVMSKMLGRPIRPNEIVHHINGIKDDNRPENLRLFANTSEHHKCLHMDRNYLTLADLPQWAKYGCLN